MLKKGFIWWVVISIVVFLFVGSWLDFEDYLDNLSSIPSWSDLLVQIRNATANLSDSWSNISSDFNIFNLGELLGNFFDTLWALITLPFKFIYYSIITLFKLFPIV